MSSKKTVLIILDGWGHGNKKKSDAIHHASTPFIDSLYDKYPNSELRTDGKFVGLPSGQMGNSEVGHLNIGAGRVVYQDLARINKACYDGSIEKNPTIINTFNYVKENNKALHLIGLVSDGGIHSHQNHLHKLCELSNHYNINKIYIHAFTDGRDCDPESGKLFIENLEKNMYNAKIASLCGRYFAMDRDNRWERIKLAYEMMVNGVGKQTSNIVNSIQLSYKNGITDEFIRPLVQVDSNNDIVGKIESGDAVICFNFRTDRCRQITQVLTQKDMPKFDMKRLSLYYTTMTNYDKSYKDVHVVFNKNNLVNTLGEILEINNCSQLRIAETEKYPHVTFFFSGGREKEFKNEKRIMINSPNVATYDIQPEMSADKVVAAVIKEINQVRTDFICLNFANADMVGHTGNYESIIKALEKVDDCTQQVVESSLKNNYAMLIIADHGNAEFSLNKDGSSNTAHTKNPVPCFLLGTEYKQINNGILADIAPTILHLMGLKPAKEMTGKTLIK
tara:strand:- start:36325 stop:37842 length:1518 start_codon:yes stop_codon:yes gene_type:complete